MLYLLNSRHIAGYITSILLLFSLYTAFQLYIEKESRASFKTLIFMAIPAGCLVFLSFLSPPEWMPALNTILIISIALLLVPIPVTYAISDQHPLNRFDERDTMFSRNELQPGSKNYLDYYSRNPEKESIDNKFRKEPGLLSKKARFYHPQFFAKAHLKFEAVKHLHRLVNLPAKSVQKNTSPDKVFKQIKKIALDGGALDIGITYTRDYHFYHTRGRGKAYAKAVEIKHSYALAFTVEMKHNMVTAAPKASIVYESANRYLQSGEIAIKIAEYIRNLGYEARAHIDGNYELICPLVARDAGLGEIGRMGLLITSKKGPRIRIGAVTTNLPLIAVKRKIDTSIQHFCLHCKKCAKCCPGKSISSAPPKNILGAKRWQINSESCFTYWCYAGTDCGRCMAVCPYSHPDSFLHRLIRLGIKNNPVFRRVAIYLDDLLYGRRPLSKKLPNYQPE